MLRSTPEKEHQENAPTIACSAGSESLEPRPAQADGKRSRKFLLVGVVIALVIASAAGLRAYSNYSTYRSGVELFNAKEFESAAKRFESIPDYRDSGDYIIESKYQQAILNLESQNYAEAISSLEVLGEYKEAPDYLTEAKMGRKYSLFNKNVDSVDLGSDGAITTPEDAENMICVLYQDWYHSDSGEALTINAFQIGGRDYVVKAVTVLDGWAFVEFCYVDEPDHTFELLPYYEYLDYIEEYIDTLDLCDLDSDTDGSDYYRAVPLDQYDQLVAENEEIAARQPKFNDSEIIDRTYNAFKSKAKGAYANGAASLYQSSKYYDANVSYDWMTQIYTCTMTCQYISNVFDMWGTSTDTYFVMAQFLDNGSDLSMVGLQIS